MIDTISKYKESPGPNLSKVDEVISSDLKDFSIPVTNEQREQFKCAIQAKYVEAIIDQLNDRFPNAELLSAFSIFDPHSLPSDEDELATYGQLSVDILMRAYVTEHRKREHLGQFIIL